jgi:UDP-N-acetylmuramyl pentapeptide phosphotransferase/UDP-N-acetylglucosamine-1-phosphate transferase
MMDEIYKLVLTFSWSLIVSLFAIPSIIYLAHKKNLLDAPNSRTVHYSLTPRLGGLAIFAGFMSALTIFGDFTDERLGVQQVLAGCIVIFFIGLKDDIVPVSAFKKFFVQVLAVGIIMFVGDIRVTNFHGFLGLYELKDGLSYGFTFIVVIGLTNAINLIDGLDGLAASIGIIITFTLGYYFYMFNSPYAFICVALAGGLVGFLKYNFKNAAVFMGDTGSLVMGFIISVSAIQFVETLPMIKNAPAVVLGTLFLPVLDTLRVFLIRVLNGVSPFAPDKNHLHHRLLELGLGQVVVVLILSALNILVIGFVLLLKNTMSLTHIVFILSTFGLMISLLLEFLPKKKNDA